MCETLCSGVALKNMKLLKLQSSGVFYTEKTSLHYFIIRKESLPQLKLNVVFETFKVLKTKLVC